MISSVSSRDEDLRSSRFESNGFDRYVPVAVWLFAVLCLAWIPLKILSYGYLPPDDALRHAAKAVDQRPWGEIIVLREGFQMDHNPGWHWLLGTVHKLTQADPESLVVGSVIFLFGLTLILPIFRIRRPEAWLGALLISTITFPDVIYRALLGRPLSVTIATTIYILLLWRDQIKSRPSLAILAATTALLAASVWLHGSWYLFALVVAAFALAGRWTASACLAGCWIVGSLLGAACTGHPLAFLWLHLRILLNSFADAPLQRMLVLEYQPTDGSPVAVLVVVALLFWRYLAGRWNPRCIQNPIFLLAILAWILGLRLGRFFSDWGMPALLLWIALELKEHLEHLVPANSNRRLGITLGLCASLVFALTSDTNSRWTRSLDVEFLSAQDPDVAPWLPEKGGILYSAEMATFYQTFFKNPHASWRYILGFEATFMPIEDFKVYRNIQRNFYSFKSFEPWVQKLRTQDRLLIRSSAPPASTIPELEWHQAARDVWIGRTRRNANGSVTRPGFQVGNDSQFVEQQPVLTQVEN